MLKTAKVMRQPHKDCRITLTAAIQIQPSIFKIKPSHHSNAIRMPRLNSSTPLPVKKCLRIL